VFVIVAALAGLSDAAVGAEEKGPAKAEASPAEQPQQPQPAKIADLIQQLDAERFADRQTASKRLAAIGKEAISALGKAAVGESTEVTIRSIDLLRGFLDSTEQATKDAARAALEQIAKSDRAAAARRAQEALAARQDDPNRLGVPGGMIPGGAVQFFGGGFRIGGGKRVSIRSANGVKDIDVDENDRKIKIHDDPKQRITIEVATKKNGKETTQKYEAKNAEELKKKHPEAHKIYQEYAENQQGAGMFQIQIQAGGGAGVPIAVPQPANAPAIPPAVVAGRRLELTTITLRAMVRQLETLSKGEELQKAPQAAKDELKKQLTELKTRLADVEKRLDQKPETPAEKPAEKKAN
jgi:hypothetical protein